MPYLRPPNPHRRRAARHPALHRRQHGNIRDHVISAKSSTELQGELPTTPEAFLLPPLQFTLQVKHM